MVVPIGLVIERTLWWQDKWIYVDSLVFPIMHVVVPTLIFIILASWLALVVYWTIPSSGMITKSSGRLVVRPDKLISVVCILRTLLYIRDMGVPSDSYTAIFKTKLFISWVSSLFLWSSWISVSWIHNPFILFSSFSQSRGGDCWETLGLTC